MANAPESVAAVVVTYNRKDLLVRCLDAVLAQTRPVDRIFVIDNASTDGTPELLLSRGYLGRPTISLVRLPANSGGAGGFHEGMRRAAAAGFDWIWLMDDDGYPDGDCLAALLLHGSRFDVLGPAVVPPEDPARLTWVLRNSDGSGHLRPGSYVSDRQALAKAAVEGVFIGDANLFNGVLVRRAVLERVGNIEPALFIRGDENDYFSRCRLAGVPIGTVAAALHFHPVYPASLNEMKFFYLLRNRVYLHAKYSRALYGRWIAAFGLAYILLRYLPQVPSWSRPYLGQVRRAVLAARHLRLVPFERSAA